MRQKVEDKHCFNSNKNVALFIRRMKQIKTPIVQIFCSIYFVLVLSYFEDVFLVLCNLNSNPKYAYVPKTKSQRFIP